MYHCKYDAADQLTLDGLEGERGHQYDLAGNRIDWQFGAGNQLLQIPQYGAFAYDANGNIVLHRADTEYQWDYGYNLRNQLAWVERTGGGEMVRVDYGYDAWGNMVSRTERHYVNGQQQGDTIEERNVVDGWEVTQDFWGNQTAPVGNERFNVIMNVESDVTFHRVYGAGIDQMQARMSQNGEIRWYLSDHQGSVLATADRTVIFCKCSLRNASLAKSRPSD